MRKKISQLAVVVSFMFPVVLLGAGGCDDVCALKRYQEIESFVSDNTLGSLVEGAYGVGLMDIKGEEVHEETAQLVRENRGVMAHPDCIARVEALKWAMHEYEDNVEELLELIKTHEHLFNKGHEYDLGILGNAYYALSQVWGEQVPEDLKREIVALYNAAEALARMEKTEGSKEAGLECVGSPVRYLNSKINTHKSLREALIAAMAEEDLALAAAEGKDEL